MLHKKLGLILENFSGHTVSMSLLHPKYGMLGIFTYDDFDYSIDSLSVNIEYNNEKDMFFSFDIPVEELVDVSYQDDTLTIKLKTLGEIVITKD